MNFIYPQFLWALSAIAIPIIIHLFNFQRPKKVMFTNVRFLRDVKASTSAMRRLHRLLVLLARILFIVFLVLAFAQPFISQNKVDMAQGKQHVSIYVDNSYSMQTELEGGTSALDASIAMVEKLVRLYPKNTDFHFQANDFEGKGQYFYNAEKIQESIAEVKLSNNFRDAATINNRQLNAFEAAHVAKGGDIFWFSDFQKSTIGDLSRLHLDTSRKYQLVPVQAPQSANIFVDSVWLATPFIKANANNTLQASVFNAGNAESQDVILKLFIDEVQVSTSHVSVAPGARASTKFTFNINNAQPKKCRITIEDQPVSFDNDYFFVLKSAQPITVMHIYQQITPYIKSVFGNTDLFTLKSYHVHNIDYSLFAKADLVVLDGLTSIDGSIADALQKQVRQGQSLAVFPAKDLDLASYNNLMARLHAVSLIKNPTIPNTDPTGTQQIALPDIKNPFYEGVFESLPRNTDLPHANPLVTWAAQGMGLLSLKNGQPFLSRIKVGQGKLYVCATPLDAAQTNFPQHAFFVPVMYRMAMLSMNEGERLAFSFQDRNIALEMPEGTAVKEQVYTLQKDGFKVIPMQRIVGKKLMLELPKTQMEAGYYDLVINGKTQKVIALNYGREESMLANYTADDLKKIFANRKNVHVFDNLDQSNDFAADFKARNIGISLWKYALMAALLFLAAEVLLIRFWK